MPGRKEARAAGAALITAMAAVAIATGTAGGQDADPVFVLEFGGHQTPPPGQLHEGGRVTVATDRDGNVWVADAANDRLVKFDYNGGFIAAFPRPRGGGSAFDGPVDVAADNRGNVFVLDGNGTGLSSHRVVVITTAGRFVRIFAPPADAGGISGGTGIATDPRGRVYVSDNGGSRILVFTAAGGLVREIATTFRPQQLDVASEIYVSDDAATLHRLSTNGTELGSVGVENIARGVAVRGDAVYVADADRLRRYVRDLSAGVFLTAEGEEPGETNEPTGVAVDCRGNVYVSDAAAFDPRGDGTSGPSKVVRLAKPGAPPPPCRPIAAPTEPVDTQVNDIEVTQGALWPRDYTATDAAAGPRTRAYGDPATELPMRIGGRTVVRVYANVRGGDEGGVVGVPATLQARAAGGRTFAPIAPDGWPAVLRVGDSRVEPAERTDPAGAYTFTLPPEWTKSRSLDLTARVNPAGIGCDDACARRSTFTLTGVPFRSTTRGCSISYGGGRPRPACDNVFGVQVKPIALTSGGRFPILPGGAELREPGPAFDVARALTPVELLVEPWYRTVEISDLTTLVSLKTESCFLGIELGITCTEETQNVDPADQGDSRDLVEGMLMDRIERIKEDNTVGDATILIGLRGGSERNDGLLPGAMRGKFLSGGAFGTLYGPRGYADVDRPMGAVAHELQHALGRRHAGDSEACYPKDQLGEPWPDAGSAGSLLGVGLDTRSGSGGARGPYRILAPGVNGFGVTLRDLMSYCRPIGENDMWISPIGWNQIITYKTPLSRRRAAARAVAAQAPRRLLRVTAIEADDGSLAITGSGPGRGAAPAADASAPYQLEARDAAATVLASAPAAAQKLDDGARVVSGRVSLPAGTTQVTLRRGTEAVTRVQQSASAPRVTLRSPRGGRLRGGSVTVRWKATDADGGALTAQVEYSPNGGRRWQALSVVPSSGSARLPMSLFAASRNARLRVRVDDGFREAVATSGRLRVDGARPIVRILAPAGGLRLRADAPLLLEGEAFASGGARLRDRALRWFDGRRRIGRGAEASVATLTPGRHRLRLAARHGGRTGAAPALVNVIAVRPAFLRLGAPARVAPSARRVVLRVASTVAARLAAGGRSIAVGRRARKVTVPIRRGSGPLTLRLTLRAGKLATTQRVVIARS